MRTLHSECELEKFTLKDKFQKELSVGEKYFQISAKNDFVRFSDSKYSLLPL